MPDLSTRPGPALVRRPQRGPRRTRLACRLALALWLAAPLARPALAADATAGQAAGRGGLRGPHVTVTTDGAGTTDAIDVAVSAEARQLLRWIAAANDHAGAAFVIVDKKRARVLVFDAEARLRAASPVLLGLALGDDSVDGIGTRPMAQVRPAERTTPAGRFVAERGRNVQGEDVVWVDYDAAVSMHRVRTGNVLERRAERLATPGIDDNRISYGCINVPVVFYERHIRPLFATHTAVVYVLPDLEPLQQVFSAVEAEAARSAARQRSAQGTGHTGFAGALVMPTP